MSLILKQNKGSRLTMADLDNNFIFLSNGGGMISGTYSSWQTQAGNNTLPAGSHIFISDRADSGIIAFCTSEGTIGNSAIGSFFVTDIQAVGTNASNNRGIWAAPYEVSNITYTYLYQMTMSVTSETGFSIGDLARTNNSTGIISGVSAGTIVYSVLTGDTDGNIWITDTTTDTTTDILSQVANTGRFTNSETVIGDNGATGYIITDYDGEMAIYTVSGDFTSATTIYGSSSYNSATKTGYTPSFYQNGRMIIWNNNHYLVSDQNAFNSGDPNYNTAAYTLLSKSIETGYILEWSDIEYDFVQDEIFWITDKRGNRISMFASNYSEFQWGDDKISDYVVETYNGYINTLNNTGTITGRQIGINTFVYLPNNTGNIYADVNGTYQALYAPENTGNIEAHVRGFSSGLDANSNSGDIKVYIEDSSYVYAGGNSGDIYSKYSDESFVSHYTNGGDIMGCNFSSFGSYWELCLLSLHVGQSHFECVYSNSLNNFTFPGNISYSNCILTNTESTFYADLFIDMVFSNNQLDLSSYNYCGIINLHPMCLVKGTKILLANGYYKNIEDILYTDLLRVWNFDEGKLDTAFPLWIKIEETAPTYNRLTFSNGTQLKTVNQHRIFNKEAGEFTYPISDATPIGTTTWTSSSEEVKLVNKETIREEVEYYNIITDRHINLFANDILTSCRFNNIYPIQCMKFIKDNRSFRALEEFGKIDRSYYGGLRLAEQKMGTSEILDYVTNLENKRNNY